MVEVRAKLLYQVELSRGSLDQMWGFSVEAELVENADRQDELCCYVSRVEDRSVAMTNGNDTFSFYIIPRFKTARCTYTKANTIESALLFADVLFAPFLLHYNCVLYIYYYYPFSLLNIISLSRVYVVRLLQYREHCDQPPSNLLNHFFLEIILFFHHYHHKPTIIAFQIIHVDVTIYKHGQGEICFCIH